MNNLTIITIALSIMLFGLISGRVRNSAITPPMVFVTLGIVAGQYLLNTVQVPIGNGFIHILAEFTLVLILFTDAARIDLSLLKRQHELPIRMLTLGLPLSIIFGTAAALGLFSNLLFWEAVVLAIILSPTDAALGQAVIGKPKVPVRIRQALNVESGLNDGIALPLLLIAVSCATVSEEMQSTGFWIRFTALQLLIGPFVGTIVGYFGGKLVEIGSQKKWMDHTFQDLSALGLSFLAYGAANLLGGNGFISAFCAGLTLGNSSSNKLICQCLYDFAEAEGQFLTLLIFMIFGSVMVPVMVEHISLPIIAYSVLSLTLVRMLAASFSLIGAGLHKETIFFLGWFGPRGVASILFALLVLHESSLAGREEIIATVVTTVFLSVFAHGLTANAGANWYAERASRLAKGPPCPEHEPAPEMPMRIPYVE